MILQLIIDDDDVSEATEVVLVECYGTMFYLAEWMN